MGVMGASSAQNLFTTQFNQFLVGTKTGVNVGVLQFLDVRAASSSRVTRGIQHVFPELVAWEAVAVPGIDCHE
jgi:hypothetical protein